jgi:hypothetical protein
MSLARKAALRNAGISLACFTIAVFMLVSNRHSRGAPPNLGVASGAASNDRWGYAFALFALAALIYNLVRWQFPGAGPNTSFERTRER